ncbi:MAG: hemolysin family protein [Cyanobacteria bacterium J06641_5]
MATLPLNLSVNAIVIRLGSIAVLIAINAFFVTAEFAMVSVRRSRISQLVDAGDVPARTVQALQRRPERLLSTMQLGITLSSLALGWIGERALAQLFVAAIPLPADGAARTAHALAVPIAFVAIAYLQIVLGELCPKAMALLYAEQLARWLGPPSLAISRVFHPFIWVLNRSTRLLLRGLGVRSYERGWYNRVTSEELQLIINTERESTGLESDERELLNKAFEFGEAQANEIMVPRTQVDAIAKTATFGELLSMVVATGHSRLPVMGESLDDIVGLIDFKSLAVPLESGQLDRDSAIEAWVRPVRFVQEMTPLPEVLSVLERSRQEVAMVVDEFGGTAGLVTLQDIVAQLLGDRLEPESRDAAPAVQILDEQTYLVQAQIDLEELDELLDIELPATEEYQTLAGFLLDRMQKIPVPGEAFQFADLEFTVVAADGPRLETIRILRRDRPETIPDATRAEP